MTTTCAARPPRPGARLRRHMKARSPAAVGAGHSRWPTPPTPPTATITPAPPPGRAQRERKQRLANAERNGPRVVGNEKKKKSDTPPPGYERGLKRFWWERRSYSCLLLSPSNCLRKFATSIITFNLGGSLKAVSFDNLIIVVIVVSSGAMAFESCDMQEGSHLAHTLDKINTIATLIFIVEMILKLISLGIFIPPKDPDQPETGGYLTQGWNRLDGFIVCSSILTMVGGGSPAIRVLRVLRVLRPLRLISKFGGMKVVISLLFKTLPKVVNVLVVSGFILLIFAILGVQLFAGKFASCSIANATTKAACLEQGGLWANPAFGDFDNVIHASLLLFEMAGMEGWPDIMYQGVDAVDVDVAPQRDFNLVSSLYFVLWIIMGGMFVLNLFVGVIVDTYPSAPPSRRSPPAPRAHRGAPSPLPAQVYRRQGGGRRLEAHDG